MDAKILNNNSRTLARIVSNAGFRRLSTNSNYKTYAKYLKKTIKQSGFIIEEECSIKELLDLSFRVLKMDYRHEYVYKTSLVSQHILNQYSLSDSVILNEFKIGKSIADLALVNGTNKVFEIKSELDSPLRLKTQINDYYKAFSEVYIVTHFSLADKYSSLVDEKVGIIELNDDFTFNTLREATKNYNALDNITMMKSLRRAEFFKIVIDLFHSLPDTTQVNLYKECLRIIDGVNPLLIQERFLDIIKQRKTTNQLLVTNANVPDYFKFFCYIENFSEKQYLSLPARLSCMV